MHYRPTPTVENPDPPRVLILNDLPRGFFQPGDPFDPIDALAADVIGAIKNEVNSGSRTMISSSIGWTKFRFRLMMRCCKGPWNSSK